MANYYGILPAFIRYDATIPPASKVLYAEIAANLNFKGVFTASNELLAQLYSVTPQTISSWLKSLKNAGYIFIHYPEDKNEMGRQIILTEMIGIAQIDTSKFTDSENEKFNAFAMKNLIKKIEGVYNNIYPLDYHNNDSHNIYNNNIYHNNNYHNMIENMINDNKQNIKESSCPKFKISSENENKFSEVALKSFDHFTELFPEKMRPKTEAQKNKWLDCLDKLERIDGYSLQVVYFITKKAREDEFWQLNFLSLLKLRQTNKQGVKYIDIFKMRFAKDLPDKLKSN